VSAPDAAARAARGGAGRDGGARGRPGLAARLVRPFESFLVEMGRLVLVLGRTLAWTPRPPYDVGQLTVQTVRIGVQSVPVVLLTALFTGAVLALQSFATLRRFNAEGYVGSLVSLSMVRELAPVIGALIVAGRCGSAMAAELGTMRVTEQIDALEVMATDPIHYLVVPRVWATTLSLPLLIALGNAVGIAGGYLVSVVLMGANPVTYIDNTFQYLDLNDWTSGLIKAAVFGLLIAVIGCAKGFHTTGGAEGVGRATTQAVVLASMAILISDFFLTKILF
jgi:phospholipid/cholesterol/gamma-HCH transport system permease protein